MVRSFTVEERRARLARRHFLAQAGDASVADVAHRFVGLHATDPATPYLSLWARLNGFTRTGLDDALYTSRTVVKLLAMRRTLWVVGGWRQDADGRVELQLLEDVGRSASKALARKADELTEWLGRVRIAPRFPSPLSKSG